MPESTALKKAIEKFIKKGLKNRLTSSQEAILYAVILLELIYDKTEVE